MEGNLVCPLTGQTEFPATWFRGCYPRLRWNGAFQAGVNPNSSRRRDACATLDQLFSYSFQSVHDHARGDCLGEDDRIGGAFWIDEY